LPAKRPLLLISCEHGGNHIPPRYRSAFAGAGRVLASHRGYDPGALELARQFARRLEAPLLYATASRLLVELNRSPGHPQLFSAYSRRLPPALRRELMERYYLPYRSALERRVRFGVRSGRRVVHLSCHSFTPRLAGVIRTADVGLLFDPARAGEAALCTRLAQRLAPTGLRVRRNYPYRGTGDGLTTYLRRRFPERAYAGIELEVNQKLPKGDRSRWRALRATLVQTFGEAL
jgi:predicted N-formylglutamate amidohydrolase